jgi:hypothetical protein
MATQKTNKLEYFYEQLVAFFGVFFQLFKSSKFYLFFAGIFSWLISTYVEIIPAFIFFCIATTLDTVSRIDANSRNKNLKFKPWKKYFWLQIKSDSLRRWFRKVFKEYLFYALIIFLVDKFILKHQLHFDFFALKLDPVTAALFLFGLNEVWSIFENREEAGYKNVLKATINICISLFPEKIQEPVKKFLQFKKEGEIKEEE